MSLTKVSFSMIEGAYLNVLDYGAVGDGTTLDTAAFDLAITAANANGVAVFVPAGTYRVGRIDLKSNVSLIGEPGTVLKRNDNILMGVSYNGTTVDNVTVENIEFDDNASGAAGTWKFCVYIADATNVTFRNCKFYNGYDVAIKDAGPDGIYISTGSSGRNDILIENCTFEEFTRNGISITNGANGVTVRGCTFKECGLFGMDVESDFGNAIYARNITVENCQFLNNGDIALRAGEITATGGLNFVAPSPVTSYHSLNTRVSGCYFKTTSAINATGIAYLSISSTYNMIVTDCIFDVPDTASPHWVMFDSGAYESDNGIVSNNVFRVLVQAYAFQNLKISGNTFSGSLAYLLTAGQGNGKLITDNNFFNAGDSTHPPIQAYSRALTISDNTFRDTRAAGVAPATVLQIAGASAGTALFTLDAVIADNNVFGAYGAFMDMSGGSSSYGLEKVKFIGNRVTDAGLGIKFNSSAATANSFDIDIENNTFSGITGTALYLSRISGLKANGNSFYDCSSNTDVILLNECSAYIANSNIIRDTRSGTSRATYAINASGNPSPSALLSSNLSLNTQSGFTIAAGEGTVANNTTY